MYDLYSPKVFKFFSLDLLKCLDYKKNNSLTIKSNRLELWQSIVKEAEFLEALGLSLWFEEFVLAMK